MAPSILLITPKFYGVEKKIKLILEESGFNVVYIENKVLKLDYHSKNSKLRFLRRIYFFLFSPQAKYLTKELKKHENIKFDILFSINAFIICSCLFKRLKRKNPDLYSVLYLWDSFSMYNWEKEIKYFKRVLTFDPEDSKEYKLEYKPNFYLNINKSQELYADYDLFFVGKFSPARLFIIDKILTQIKNSNIKYFIKLLPYYKIFLHNYFTYKIFKNINFKSNWVNKYLLNYEAFEGIVKREYFISKSLNYEEMKLHMLSSNVILDLPFKRQTGYTHRLVEALANGKKIITTNSNIIKESFYNSNQVHLIDERNLEIDDNWVKEKSTYPVDSFFLELELSTWIKSLINVEIA